MRDNVKVQGIEERIEKRQQILEKMTLLTKEQKKLLKDELQQDHQQLLMLEVEEKDGDKAYLIKLRQEIVKQQQELATVAQLKYQKTAQKMAPKAPVIKNVLAAFLVGGTICAIGQIMFNIYSGTGLQIKEASTATSATLVFLGALFTGLGIYDNLGKFAGAGSIIPITGFANSIVAPALEFKSEGFIYGVGARLFTIAGPVLVYGTVISMVIGLVYYFFK